MSGSPGPQGADATPERARGRRAGRILLCAAGGYQSYALPGFVLSLLKHVADDVQVVLSRSAARLVSRYAVEVASRHPVFVEMEDTGPDVFVPHIELGRAADVVLVYPATVNILGKVAQGIADELIAALVLATPAPTVFVPGVNPGMWTHPAVVRNVATLRSDGYLVLEPPPVVEVATREGMDAIQDPFPFPTLFVELQAVVRGTSAAGRVRRVRADARGSA